MSTAPAQHIFHGNVGQDKYASGRVRTEPDQPVTEGDPLRTPPVNTPGARTQKRSTHRRLRQIASWIDDPLMLQLKAYAADKHLSMSEAVRGLLREMMNQKLEKQYAAALPEMIDAAVARGLSRTATQTAYFLVTILFELGQVKDFSTNTLGMQEGVTEELLKNILEDADQRTRHSLSRKNPKLTPFIKAVEEWLLAGEDEAGELPAPNGKANGKKEGTASWP